MACRGSTQVRSLSKAGLSQVVIIFEDGVDTYWTRQIVFERLSLAREQLPPGRRARAGADLAPGSGEIFQYTLEGDGKSAMELRTVQDWIVAPLLKPIPGVNEVNSFGGEVKQYQVLVSPEKLLKYGLTVGEVVEAVEQGNANAGGGVVVRGWEQLYLRGVGLLKDIPDIERIVLKAEDGAPVYVRDVADVVIGAEPRQGAVSRDGKGEVVAGMIIMLKGENSQDVVSRVKDADRQDPGHACRRGCGSTSSTTGPRSSRRASRPWSTRSSRAASSSSWSSSSSSPSSARRSSSSSRCRSPSW